MESYRNIIWEQVEDGIGVLTLNRPQAYNAIDGDMLDDLYRFWEARYNDLETAVIIMRGSGEKGFCSGLDIKWAIEKNQEINSPVESYRFQARLARLNLAMRRAPQPIITTVHGASIGIGFSIVLASDIRIISPDTRFCAGFINIGLGGADMACSYFLPRMIGAGRAYEFMYTGDFMSAQDAMNLGLVSKIVERNELYDTVLKYAQKLASKNRFGLRLTKEAINMNIDAGGLEQALCMEDRNQILLTVASGLKSTI